MTSKNIYSAMTYISPLLRPSASKTIGFLNISMESVSGLFGCLAFMLSVSLLWPLDTYSREHQVRRGDSLESIASLYGTTTEEIMLLNQSVDRIHVGLVLQVPDAPAKHAQQSASRVMDSDFTHGEALYGLKEYKKAAKSFGKSIKRAPNAYAYYNRGLCHFHMEKWRQASEDFDKAVNTYGESLPDEMLSNAEELLKVSRNNHAAWVQKRDNAIASIVGTVILASATVATAATMADSGVSMDLAQPVYSFPNVGITPTSVASSGLTQIPYDPSDPQSTYNAIMSVTMTQMKDKENQLTDQCRQMYLLNYNREPTQMEIVQFLTNAYAAENGAVCDSNGFDTDSADDLENRRRETLNTAAGEKCGLCKGSGLCHSCGGTKVAESFGHSYHCTVCGDDGKCPLCKGTGLASWNR